jgi:hypothetical protein
MLAKESLAVEAVWSGIEVHLPVRAASPHPGPAPQEPRLVRNTVIRGAPDAMRVARPVQRAGRVNGSGETPTPVNGQVEVSGFGQWRLSGLHGGSGLGLGACVPALGLAHAV